jgi:hypothetical protein
MPKRQHQSRSTKPPKAELDHKHNDEDIKPVSPSTASRFLYVIPTFFNIATLVLVYDIYRDASGSPKPVAAARGHTILCIAAVGNAIDSLIRVIVDGAHHIVLDVLGSFTSCLLAFIPFGLGEFTGLDFQVKDLNSLPSLSPPPSLSPFAPSSCHVSLPSSL